MKELYENRILIVDDTPDNINILVELLRNFDIKVAINGLLALEAVKTDPVPDLILLDIMMPEMDGFEVCRRIRADEQTKDIPIIFITSKNQKEDVVQGFELGGQDYITKPFDYRELMARIKTHLVIKSQKEDLENMNQNLELMVKERTHQLQDSNERLAKANHELQGLEYARSNFLRLINHELRTPLNGIVGMTEILEEMMDKDNELFVYFEMLCRSARRLDRFSSASLLITQLQAENFKIERKETSVKDIVNESIDELGDFVSENDVKILTSIGGNQTCSADPELIVIAIKSVLHNAIRFSKAGDQIELVTKELDGKCQIQVKDHGPGFSDEAKRNLFKPFGIGEDHADNSLGLSLRTTKMIMDAHGGEIEIQSEKDVGATVTLTF
jgi:two-component system sensor histidine kinase/response regulator